MVARLFAELVRAFPSAGLIKAVSVAGDRLLHAILISFNSVIQVPKFLCFASERYIINPFALHMVDLGFNGYTRLHRKMAYSFATSKRRH